MTDETLDPETSEGWYEYRELGRQMIEDMIEYLKTVRDRPLWRQMGDEEKRFFESELPKNGIPLKEIYEQFKGQILPYNMGNIHPRFWGWVIGGGTTGGALADMLASFMNPNSGGGDHVSQYVEKQIIQWSGEMLGLGSDVSGLLVTGGSMANFIGLTAARNTRGGADIIQKGIPQNLTYYCSEETHSSVNKSIQILGIGLDNLRKIPVDSEYSIRLDKLKEQISRDISEGFHPVCVIGNAGTVNTGGIDNLEELSIIAKEHNLWFHVDGAIGAVCAVSKETKNVVKGLNLADSVAFDFHKWMFVNYEVGCILVKNKIDHYKAFSLTASYLTHQNRGIGAGDLWFSDYGLDLSRRFKALKVWFSLKEHGINKYGRIIAQNIFQAQYLTDRITAEKSLELLAPTTLNIVNFRVIDPNVKDLNKLNQEILYQLHERGIAAPSSTILDDKFSIRVANVNHRSKLSDFDLLVDSCLEIAKSII